MRTRREVAVPTKGTSGPRGACSLILHSVSSDSCSTDYHLNSRNSVEGLLPNLGNRSSQDEYGGTVPVRTLSVSAKTMRSH